MKANEVIKVESLEHGQKVKKYFESLGIDTKTLNFVAIGSCYGLMKYEACCWSTDQVFVKGLKIIKLPEEKPYPRVMMVSLNKFSKSNRGIPRVVFMEKNNKYIAWRGAETIKDSETKTCTVCWEYAKDIEPETIVELTLQDVSDGKGVGAPSHLIRIKE